MPFMHESMASNSNKNEKTTTTNWEHLCADLQVWYCMWMLAVHMSFDRLFKLSEQCQHWHGCCVHLTHRLNACESKLDRLKTHKFRIENGWIISVLKVLNVESKLAKNESQPSTGRLVPVSARTIWERLLMVWKLCTHIYWLGESMLWLLWLLLWRGFTFDSCRFDILWWMDSAPTRRARTRLIAYNYAK